MAGGRLGLPAATLSSCRTRRRYQVLSSAGADIWMIGLQHSTQVSLSRVVQCHFSLVSCHVSRLVIVIEIHILSLDDHHIEELEYEAALDDAGELLEVSWQPHVSGRPSKRGKNVVHLSAVVLQRELQ